MLVRIALAVLVASSFAPSLRAQTGPEVRLSGTTVLLGQGDTPGLVAAARVTVPVVETATRSRAIGVFGGVSGLRAGRDFHLDPDYGFDGGVGYGQRTLLTADAGLGARIGWVELAVGPSIRYRSESLVQASIYDVDADRYRATVIEEERTDIGLMVETGLQMPVSETVGLGAHVSLRRYNTGTQVAGVGVSGSVRL